MNVGTMREQGLTTVGATCRACGRRTLVDVSGLPASVPVSEVGTRLRCAACDSRAIDTRPNWAELGEWRCSEAEAERSAA